jgi:hypothetical protein
MIANRLQHCNYNLSVWLALFEANPASKDNPISISVVNHISRVKIQ